jgi:hypothetical protein
MTVAVASSTVTAGDPITVSWTNGNPGGPRGYLISYSCTDGISLDAPLPDHTYRKVPCNTGFNYTNAQSSVMLRTHLSGTAAKNVVVTVAAVSLATGSTTATASATVSIRPSAGAAPSPKPSTTTTKPKTTPAKVTSYSTPAPKGYVSNPYGYPDLAVRILAVGYIDPQSGAFVPVTNGYLPYATTMAVQFSIQNVGSKTVNPGWNFSASVPAIDGLTTPYTYNSVPEAALAPGQGIVFTLRWSAPTYAPQQVYCTQQTGYTQGYDVSQYPNPYCPQPAYPNVHGTVSVTADPYGNVPDANRYNNSASRSF